MTNTRRLAGENDSPVTYPLHIYIMKIADAHQTEMTADPPDAWLKHGQIEYIFQKKVLKIRI